MTRTSATLVTSIVLTLGALGTLVSAATAQSAQTETADEPLRVRNDVAIAGEEFLVLRHQYLERGSHERFYEISRDGVWPWYEKLGTRVVGQWQVIHPNGVETTSPPHPEHDEGYRLARYRSYNHWAATRQGQNLAGNGADFEANRAALRERGELLRGSKAVHYLQGDMATGGPYHWPALAEDANEPSASDQSRDERIAVRHGRARPGREIVTLRRFKIRKGSFAEFNRLSKEMVWPYFEKLGARIVGQWQVVYPSPGRLDRMSGTSGMASESADYDEAFMMVRYASVEHWRATRPPVMAQLGGNGRDYDLCVEGLERRRALTVDTSVDFLQGHFHGSPPVYLPTE